MMYAAIAVAVIAVAALVIVLVIRNNPGGLVSLLPSEKVSVENVKHISFPQLSVESGEGRLSVGEFKSILEDLSETYTLIDFYSMVTVSDDGTISLNDTVEVYEGREPLIISQRDVSYPIERAGEGYADKLVLTEDGDIACEYTDASGNIIEGDYDLIPILESFIEENPEFSYKGARGIIALTGYNGILGYRTSTYLSSQEDNPYGIFDTAGEINAVAPLVEKLKKNGWRFASYGFDDMSYGAEYSLVAADLEKWLEQVSNLVGGSDMIIFPRQTDIGSWMPYAEGNRKFELLYEAGFRYFFINETESPWLLQEGELFIRQGIYEINTYSDYIAAFG